MEWSRPSKDWRSQVLNGLLRGIVIFGFVAVAAGIYNTLADPLLPSGTKTLLSIAYVIAYLATLAIAFINRIPYGVKTATLLGILYLIGVLGLHADGLSGDGRVFILTFAVVGAIFLERKFAFGILGIAIGTLAVFGWLFSSGTLYIPPEHLANTADAGAWTTGTLVELMLAIAAILPITYVIQELERDIHTTEELLRERESRQEGLEQTIQERTKELERKTRQLQAASQVAREITSVSHNVEDLLQNTTELISKEFGFYHAGIFLLDAKKEYAILQAASSEGGKRMLERGHRLRVGVQGVVGAAAVDKRPYIALDVGEDAAHFVNPDLPLTRSEMALPLIVNDEVIGILDIQSTNEQAFTQEDIGTLQTLADQVAIAIQNARLLAESRSAIEELQALSTRETLEAWRKRLRQRPLKYRYTPLGTFPASDTAEEDTHPTQRLRLKVPILLRGQSIGTITLSRPPDFPWTEQESNLAKTIGEQIGMAIENARLVENTRARAQREELISEVSSRMRATLDMDTVLQTAVQEIQKALNLQTVEVTLGLPEDAQGDTP